MTAGTCGCGCGEPTEIAPYTRTERGWKRGEPKRFIHGHNPRRVHIDPLYRVDPDTDCWVWARPVGDSGYGQLRDGARMRLAHRVFYERYVGPIPEGLTLDHLCRNRACVNPAHLEAVSYATNQQRGMNAKLNWPKVREIRRRARAERFVDLAAEFRVSPSCIQSVVHRRRWKVDPLEQ